MKRNPNKKQKHPFRRRYPVKRFKYPFSWSFCSCLACRLIRYAGAWERDEGMERRGRGEGSGRFFFPRFPLAQKSQGGGIQKPGIDIERLNLENRHLKTQIMHTEKMMNSPASSPRFRNRNLVNKKTEKKENSNSEKEQLLTKKKFCLMAPFPAYARVNLFNQLNVPKDSVRGGGGGYHIKK